jgi:hypothetical protein
MQTFAIRTRGLLDEGVNPAIQIRRPGGGDRLGPWSPPIPGKKKIAVNFFFFFFLNSSPPFLIFFALVPMNLPSSVPAAIQMTLGRDNKIN